MRPESLQRIRISTVVGDRILASPWVRRLARISFLGTLEAHPSSRARSTRWEHSLGVADSAVAVAKQLSLDPPTTRTFVAAGLLHDVGHYPLSHAAEPAFTRVFGHGHHGVTEWIIRGRNADGQPATPISEVLADEGIDADLVWQVIDGSATDPLLRELSGLLSAPINLDTLEGIPRVARDFRIRHEANSKDPLFTLVDGELHLAPPGIERMDAFWRLKDLVYSTVINLPSNILAEARLCDLVLASVTPREHEGLLDLDDPWLAELLGRALDAVMPARAEDATHQLVAHDSGAPALVRMRKRYYVDTRTEASGPGLPRSRWAERYRHERSPAYLVSQDRQLELPGFATSESPEI